MALSLVLGMVYAHLAMQSPFQGEGGGERRKRRSPAWSWTKNNAFTAKAPRRKMTQGVALKRLGRWFSPDYGTVLA